MNIRISAAAKLNFFLHINGKREDGYHILQSLIGFVGLSDELVFKTASKISLKVLGQFSQDSGDVGNNLVVQAAKALHQYAVLPANVGAEIILQKNIPVGAGLGGGSADAASCLKALNALWNLNYDLKILQVIAETLGADIPACLENLPILVQGVGEKIVKPVELPEIQVLLVFPNEFVATSDVFKNGDFLYKPLAHVPDGFKNVDALVSWLDKNTNNDLHESAIDIAPAISDALEMINNSEGCLFSRMTGSGSCCFGIFENNDFIISAREQITSAKPEWFVYAEKPCK